MDRAELLRLVVCPVCRGPIEARASVLECRACGTSFPCEGGVPVLLTREDRETLEATRASWGGERLRTEGNSRVLGVLRGLVPRSAPFLNLASGRNLERLGQELRRLGREVRLLDLGCGSGEGAGLARLGRDLREGRTVHLDVDVFPGVELVGVGHRLPFPDATFDAVLLKAVLEHVPEPERVLEEAHRVLADGGWLYVELPFLYQYHPNPGDYMRLTKAGLERALRAFGSVEVGTLVGPWAAASSLLALAAAIGLSFGSRHLRRGLEPFLTWLFWPLSLPDLLCARFATAHAAAHHLFAFARRENRGSPGPQRS